MVGKWIDDNFDNLSKEYNCFISKKIELFYKKKIYYITNPILSRNIHNSKCFEYYCKYKYDKRMPNKIGFIKKIKKITIYYFKSFLYFTFFILHFFIYKIAYKKRLHKINTNKEVILIDTFTMIDKIYPNGFKDNYFGDLFWNILKKNNKEFIILSILFGDKPYNLRRRYLTYKLLEEDHRFFLSEFEVITFIDYIKLFYFILVYPIFHLNTKIKKENNNIDILYNISIDETLDMPQWHNYLRYLYGKRIGENFKNIKLISWDENQVIHKLLNKGLKENNSHVFIIGTKFFGFTKQWLSLVNLTSETKMSVSPDKIVVKGKYYKQFYKHMNCKVGYAPRESYLVQLNIKKTSEKFIGVLFSYDVEENRKIIEYLITMKFKNIIYRLHPNHTLNPPFSIPKNWINNNNTLINFAQNCNIIISGGTGAAFEIMCMNKYVLVIGKNDGFTTLTVPNEYKNYNWDIFYSKEDLKILLEKNLIPKKAINLKCFFELENEKKIIKSFGL